MCRQSAGLSERGDTTKQGRRSSPQRAACYSRVLLAVFQGRRCAANESKSECRAPAMSTARVTRRRFVSIESTDLRKASTLRGSVAAGPMCCSGRRVAWVAPTYRALAALAGGAAGRTQPHRTRHSFAHLPGAMGSCLHPPGAAIRMATPAPAGPAPSLGVQHGADHAVDPDVAVQAGAEVPLCRQWAMNGGEGRRLKAQACASWCYPGQSAVRTLVLPQNRAAELAGAKHTVQSNVVQPASALARRGPLAPPAPCQAGLTVQLVGGGAARVGVAHHEHEGRPQGVKDCGGREWMEMRGQGRQAARRSWPGCKLAAAGRPGSRQGQRSGACFLAGLPISPLQLASTHPAPATHWA